MTINERIDKFINSKPTKLEKVFVKVFAIIVSIAFVAVVSMIIYHLIIGDLF